MIARPAAAGPWCDTSWRCTPSIAAAVRASGRLGVGRYVALPDPADLARPQSSAGDVTGTEIGCILDAGLELLLVQHVRRPPWYPDQHSGEADGRMAARLATEVGYPNGAHLFLDLEGIGQGLGADSMATARFANDWARVVVGEGFLAGLYVGYAVPLTPVELYSLPLFSSYWSDAGRRLVAVRGCAIQQEAPEIVIGGARFDPDVITPDGRGEVPVVLAAA